MAFIRKRVIRWTSPHLPAARRKLHHHWMVVALRAVWATIKSRRGAFPKQTIVLNQSGGFEALYLGLCLLQIGHKTRILCLERCVLLFQRRLLLLCLSNALTEYRCGTVLSYQLFDGVERLHHLEKQLTQNRA